MIGQKKRTLMTWRGLLLGLGVGAGAITIGRRVWGTREQPRWMTSAWDSASPVCASLKKRVTGRDESARTAEYDSAALVARKTNPGPDVAGHDAFAGDSDPMSAPLTNATMASATTDTR